MGRGFAEPGRGFSDQRFKPEKSGGFHPFGGGHNNEFASAGKMPRGFGGEKMPKMPKSFGHESMPKAPHFSEHGHGGGGHSGGGHFFGGHHLAATDPLAAAQQPAQSGTAIVPAHSHDFDSDPNRDRGQS